MKSIPFPNARQTGLSLVEFLVSLLIGMLIVLVAVTSLFGTRSTSLASENVNELQQSAAHAFHLLRRHIAQAGFAPVDLSGNRGYYDTNASTPTNVDGESEFFAVKGTEGGDGKNDTLKVGYAPSPDYFKDCLGQEVGPYNPLEPLSSTNVRLITSEFAVNADGKLTCRGNGAKNTPPLVEGVERFDVMYGVAATATTNQIVKYEKASALNGAEYMKVRAVRVCLQLVGRTAGNPPQTYVDCDGKSQTLKDGKLRGVFASTFALRNNLGAL